jgi:glycosyltransferase involved in cell wall biosynthesis
LKYPPRLIRVTTAPISLSVLLPGQMKFMSEKGMQVTMISSDGPELLRVLERECCWHIIVPMTRRLSPFQDFVCLWKLYLLFRREKPDIVHSHTPKAGLLAMLAAKLAGVKHRIHTVGGLRYATTKGILRSVLVSMERLTGWAATEVWPNSFSMFRVIKDKELVAEDKLRIIGKGSSNGVDIKKFNRELLDIEKRSEISKRFNYEAGIYNYLFVGRIVQDKGIKELVGAFDRVNQIYPNCRLVMVGDFEDEVDPVSGDTRKGMILNKNIIVTGWSNAVNYHMSLCDVLIHPSHREGFPNVLMQAGAASLPVICSEIDGNTDIIKDGETGIIFPCGDEQALFDSMMFAIQNRGVMSAYADHLHRHIVEGYSSEFVHAELFKNYQRLLA